MLGTFLYQSISHAAPFVVGAACFVASLLSLLFIKTSLRVERPPATSSLRAEISQGVRWLWAQQVIFRLALVMGVLNMVSAAMPFFGAFRKKLVAAIHDGAPWDAINKYYTAVFHLLPA